MAKEIFKIYKSNRCYFEIKDFAPEQRKSAAIIGEWSGFVNQYRNNESVTEIKENAKQWLRKKLKQKFDSQFSSKNSFEYLLKELEKENQLELF